MSAVPMPMEQPALAHISILMEPKLVGKEVGKEFGKSFALLFYLWRAIVS
jgi:hypothetical protein